MLKITWLDGSGVKIQVHVDKHDIWGHTVQVEMQGGLEPKSGWPSASFPRALLHK